MKSLKFFLVAVGMLAMTAIAAQDSFAGGLANAGFERGPFVDDGNGVGKWNPFSSGAAGTSEQGTTMPRTGTGALELAILGESNQFAGVFQDVTFGENSLFEFSGYHKDASGTNGTGIEIRFEYRDAVGEISRTPNFTPASLGTDYEPFTFSDTTPAGTTAVRVVYAIQSFGGDINQMVFVDDTRPVPEPASLALLGLGGIAIVTMRHRKQ